MKSGMRSCRNWHSFLSGLNTRQRKGLIKQLTKLECEALFYDWQFWARDKQLPPEGEWRVWLLLAGRGFGKTRAGAEWIRWRVETGQAHHIGLVGNTFDDVRSVMIEGPSGILAVSSPQSRPEWLSSRRLLRWPSGAKAYVFAAESPEQLRGPEFDTVWADEIAKWRYRAAWDNLMLGLRRGSCPQVMASTTPRARQWLKDLSEQPDCVLVTGRTAENEAHLSPDFAQTVRSQLAHDRLARQELDGILMTEPEDGLWRFDQLEAVTAQPPPRNEFTQIVIGVDPAIGGGDETGIIVAGRHKDGQIWVLADATTTSLPHQWIKVIYRQAEKFRADAIIAEVNQGGALIRHLMEKDRTGRRIAVRAARAVGSKSARAYPVAAAYSRGEVSHADWFADLAEQMVGFSPSYPPGRSPDRLDALVWAVSALLKGIATTQNEFRL